MLSVRFISAIFDVKSCFAQGWFLKQLDTVGGKVIKLETCSFVRVVCVTVYA